MDVITISEIPSAVMLGLYEKKNLNVIVYVSTKQYPFVDTMISANGKIVSDDQKTKLFCMKPASEAFDYCCFY